MIKICRRTSKSLLFSIFFILLSGISCSSEEDVLNPEISQQEVAAHIEKDIQYGSHSQQTYDLYLPADRSPSKTKILVLLHGGGWIGGDKKNMEPYIPLLQKKHPEHAIVNLNYRLAEIPDRAAFPDQFLDVKKALEQIAGNAKERKIKPVFGIIGVSAGAHLALQYDAKYDKKDRVKMVCSIVGPTNLTDPFYKNNKNFDLAIDYLINEDAYPDITKYAKAVSPLYQVSSKSSATILFYGEVDPLVPLRSGISLKEQLDSIGVPNTMTIFEGGHGDWNKNENEFLQQRLSSYIDAHLPVN